MRDVRLFGYWLLLIYNRIVNAVDAIKYSRKHNIKHSFEWYPKLFKVPSFNTFKKWRSNRD